MKTLIATIITVTMIGLMAAACESSSDTRPTPGESPTMQPAPPAHRVEIGLGASVELPDQGIGISFDRVVEDSQCRPNVVCIWAGQVVIELTVTQADTSAVVRPFLEPGSGDDQSPWATVPSSHPGSEDISIRLLSLELSPASDDDKGGVLTAVLEGMADSA